MMENKTFLYEKFDNLAELVLELEALQVEIPHILIDNLNPKFSLRDYQNQAFKRFIYYNEKYSQKTLPIHLMFNMATGSGKTMLMAGLMLYLFNKGYKNFIFFVNSSNIVEKTKSNFLDSSSSKYLFSQKGIFIEGKQVEIKEVQNFDFSDDKSLNIHFTTIQGLHTTLNKAKENAVSYADLTEKKLVLLADEGHHINTLTKQKLNKTEREEKQSWEGTVKNIFEKNRDNILLEFTATIDLGNSQVHQKYLDKILYRYDLAQFRNDGFSKEIETLQLDFQFKDIMLASILLSQYRLKVAEKNKLLLKPVILFKAQKTIEQNNKNQETFFDLIKNLSIDKIKQLKKNLSKGTILDKVFKYFKNNNISLENILEELKEDFKPENCLNVNKDEDLKNNQLLLNSLEDKDNHIRAIFAVNKLNEGWDVLNLFDIVRLYDTRDAKGSKVGKTTIAEAQLIGRGARYFPFILNNNEEEKFIRKFDKDRENELRILESLYYHSIKNSRYISELHSALVQVGLKDKNTVEKPIKIKESERKGQFYKEAIIFLNEKKPNKNEDKKSNTDYKINFSNFSLKLASFASQEKSLFANNENFSLEQEDSKNIPSSYRIEIKDMNKHIIRHSLNKNPFYRFDNLKNYYPSLKSIKEFIESANYLGEIQFNLSTSDYRKNNLTPDDDLWIIDKVLDEYQKQMKANNHSYRGTKKFKEKAINKIFTDKVLHINKDKDLSIELNEEVRQVFLYDKLFGTEEEENFINFFSSFLEKLKTKYEEIKLIRNERQAKLYNFEDGRGFEPDFILFLNSKENQNIHYQLFIEPKGEHLKLFDEWKENFLKTMSQEIKIETLFENKEYKIIGLPFYNKNNESIFQSSLQENLQLNSN